MLLCEWEISRPVRSISWLSLPVTFILPLAHLLPCLTGGKTNVLVESESLTGVGLCAGELGGDGLLIGGHAGVEITTCLLEYLEASCSVDADVDDITWVIAGGDE